jgi:prepilin-type processing-associated H-X9-DG protein
MNAQPVVNYHNDAEIYSFHQGGANLLFADGHVQFAQETLDTGVGIALVTRAGEEIIPGTAL